MKRFLFLFGIILSLQCFALAQQDGESPASAKPLCEINHFELITNNTGTIECSLTEDNETSTGRRIAVIPIATGPTTSNTTDDSNTTQGDFTFPDENRFLVFTKSNISGTLKTANDNDTSANLTSTAFVLLVAIPENAEAEQPIAGVMVQISYDFDGDGQVDKIELYEPLILDQEEDTENATDSLGRFKVYSGNQDSLLEEEGGNFTDFSNGSVTVLIWSPFGNTQLELAVGKSNETLDIDTLGDLGSLDTANLTLSVSIISFPYDFATENDTDGGIGGGNTTACCAEVDEIRTELEELRNRLDQLSTRLLNVTRNCCETNGTSGTGATGAGTGTGAETGTGAGTGAETGTGAGTGAETGTGAGAGTGATTVFTGTASESATSVETVTASSTEVLTGGTGGTSA